MWVSTLAGELAVGDGLLAGLDERDGGDGAESKFGTPAPDDEALDPAADASRLNIEVQAVAVDVVPRRCGSDEAGFAGVVGMASPALGSAAWGGDSISVNIPALYTGKVVDSARRPGGIKCRHPW